jgi:hypothetical protein
VETTLGVETGIVEPGLSVGVLSELPQPINKKLNALSKNPYCCFIEQK